MISLILFALFQGAAILRRAEAASCDRPTDVLWVLDGSTSIGLTPFNTKMRPFVADVASSFDLNPDGLQMGVMQFAGEAFSLAQMMNIPLDAKLNTSAFVRQALSITYMQKGGTATGYALEQAVTVIQTQGRDSLLTGRIVVVITDGQSQDQARTIASADRARSLGINVICVTVGSGYSVPEVVGISGGDPSMLFNVESFSSLGGRFVGQLSHLICDAPIRWPNLTPITNLVAACSMTVVPVQFMITLGSLVPVSLTVTSLGYGLASLKVCTIWSAGMPAWSNFTAIMTPIACLEAPTVLLLGSTVGLRRASISITSLSPASAVQVDPSSSKPLQLFMGVFPVYDPSIYYAPSVGACSNNISVTATMPTPSATPTASVTPSTTPTRTRTPVTASTTPTRTRTPVSATATASPASATATATRSPSPSSTITSGAAATLNPAGANGAISGGDGKDSTTNGTVIVPNGADSSEGGGGVAGGGSGSSQAVLLGGVVGGVLVVLLILGCCLFWLWWRPRKQRIEREARLKLQQSAQAEAWAKKGHGHSRFVRTGAAPASVNSGVVAPKGAVPRLSLALQSLKPNPNRRVSEFGKRHSKLAFHTLSEGGAATTAEAAAEVVGIMDDDDEEEGDGGDDDAPDEEEAVVDASARVAGAKAAQPWKRAYESKSKNSASNALAPAAEQKKLVIGEGALVQEKVTEQRVVLRRVSNVRGDQALTAARKQAAARPSVAATFSRTLATAGVVESSASTPGASAGTTNPAAGSHEALVILSPYSFHAAVARQKVRVPTKRALTTQLHTTSSAAAAVVNPLDDDESEEQ